MKCIGILYSGDKGIARNLKVDDVNDVIGVEVDVDVNTYYVDNEGGTPKVSFGTKIKDIEDETMKLSNRNNTPDNLDVGEYGITYYHYKGSEYLTEENNKEYNLIFKDETGTEYLKCYWLSSNRCFPVFDVDVVGFGIFTAGHDDVEYDNIFGFDLYSTSNSSSSFSFCGRPIVILNSDVEVNTATSGDGSSASSAWQLK